jgi:c-di-GMP-binding flagellar brake protein YcgR
MRKPDDYAKNRDNDSIGSRLLFSRTQIIRLFQRFIKEAAPISVEFEDRENMLVTRALDLDERTNRVFYAFGDYKATNALIFQSKQLFFNLDAQRVRYRFVGTTAGDALRNGAPVFHLPLPESVLESDRRARDRHRIPQVRAPDVSLRLPDGSVIRGILADVSEDGLGVIDVDGNLNFRTGTDIPGCVIELGGRERIRVDLKVLYVALVPDKAGKNVRRMGIQLLSRPEEFDTLLKAFIVEL